VEVSNTKKLHENLHRASGAGTRGKIDRRTWS